MQQATHSQLSLEGDSSDLLPLNTSTPSSSSQANKLSMRREAEQSHIILSSDSEDSDDNSSDEETFGDFDPDNFYASSNSQFPKIVNDYIEKHFRQCIPREQRKKMLRNNPISSTPAAKVPQAYDIVAFLGQEFLTSWINACQESKAQQ